MLQVLRVLDFDDVHYVNVDTTTARGIQRAKSLSLIESNMADIIVSPLIHEISELFSPTHQGRMFAVFRNPIDRIVSQFYYLQNATWEPTYNPAFAKMTIAQYVRSDIVESNWMVRTLVNKMVGPLSSEDLPVAKEILRKKCVVGLMGHLNSSIARFEKYFGFTHKSSKSTEEIQRCVSKYMRKGSNSHRHPTQLDRETEEILTQKNGLDIELFRFAQKLFLEQESLFSNATPQSSVKS